MIGVSDQRGFSLVELMIAVVIVAILAAVAIPSYQQFVIDGYRAQAQADLLAVAQAMERGYSTNLTYQDIADSQSPTTGDAVYDIAVAVAGGGSTFTVTATPVSTRSNQGDGALRVNHLGQRFWEKGGTGAGFDAGWED